MILKNEGCSRNGEQGWIFHCHNVDYLLDVCEIIKLMYMYVGIKN